MKGTLARWDYYYHHGVVPVHYVCVSIWLNVRDLQCHTVAPKTLPQLVGFSTNLPACHDLFWWLGQLSSQEPHSFWALYGQDWEMMTGQIAWGMLLLYQRRRRFLWPGLHRFPSHSNSQADSVEAPSLIVSGLVACHCHALPPDEEHDILYASKGASHDCTWLHLILGNTSWGCIRSTVACHDDQRSRNPCAWRPSAPCWFGPLCPFLWLSWDHMAAFCSNVCFSNYHPCPTASPSTHSLADELVSAVALDEMQSQGYEGPQVLPHQVGVVLLRHAWLRHCLQWFSPTLLSARSSCWMDVFM